MSPAEVRTCGSNPILVTLQRGASGSCSAMALAVSSTSRIEASPESNTPSQTRTAISTSEILSIVSFPRLTRRVINDVRCGSCWGALAVRPELEGNVVEIGLLVSIEAKPEFADQVESALRGARDLAERERETVAWFAFRQSPTVFGVFDTFNDEHGREQHLQGQIAAALGQIAQTMLASPPVIREIDLLGVKVP